MKRNKNVLAWRLRLTAFLIVGATIVCHSSRSGRADGPLPPMFRKGEVVVEIMPTAKIEDINARVGTSTIQRIPGTYFYRLLTPKMKKEKKFRKKLAKDPEVVSASLNPIVVSPLSLFGRSTVGFPDGHASPGQSRGQYESQALFGDMAGIHIRSAGAGVIVAVIDTGVDLTHPDLATHLWTNPDEVPGDGVDNDDNGLIDDVQGWDFITSTKDPSETPGNPETTVAGHGTFIAGLIALMAPGAKILPIRAFDPAGVSDAFTVSQAIKYAADSGAKVINLSFGSADDSQLMHDAVDYATQRGSVLIAAVGNDDANTDILPQFPAGWDQEVIGVAAVDSNDRKADFSNYGSNVSVAAPGVQLFSLYPRFESGVSPYARWSGTSFASPLAAAEAALILERSSRFQRVRDLIETTVANIDDRNPAFRGLLGRGRVDPLRALQGFDPPPSAHAEITLYPTSVETAAEGEANIEITDAEQSFEVEARYLVPHGHYKLLVDGSLVADAQVTPQAVCGNFGGLKIEFSTRPDANHLLLPPPLIPVTSIKHVELRDAQDRVVLQNDFLPATGGVGGGPPGQTYEKEARLAPTAVAPLATGRAKIEVDPERDELEVEGEGLLSGSSYQIFADGVALGSTTIQSGYFRVRYTSDGSSGLLLPPSLEPASRISHIEVRDSLSRVVLQGTLQPGGDDIGGGGDGGGETSFDGLIEALPGSGLIGDWTVDGKTVHVSVSTEIRQDKGPAVLGAKVEVKGAQQQDGSVNATRIEVLSEIGGGGGGGESIKFTGTIQVVPLGLIGDWTVSGTTVHVVSSTGIDQRDGSAVVGATVEVEGTTRPDGSVTAFKIKVKKTDDG